MPFTKNSIIGTTIYFFPVTKTKNDAVPEQAWRLTEAKEEESQEITITRPKGEFVRRGGIG